jgi:hypothetical protein
MKRYVSLFCVALIAGCGSPAPVAPPKVVTTTTRRGRDFDTSRAKDIQNNQTTTTEIIKWFGEPFAKKIVSTNQIGWLYEWNQSTLTTDRSTKTVNTRETGYRKKLELLIIDDVVRNHIYDEGPFEGDRTTNAR